MPQTAVNEIIAGHNSVTQILIGLLSEKLEQMFAWANKNEVTTLTSDSKAGSSQLSGSSLNQK